MTRLLVLAVLAASPAWAQNTPVQITSGPQKDRDPVISPDGHLLAFSSDRTGHDNIFLYDFRQQGIVQLTHSDDDDRYPSWGPDSKRLIFNSKRTGKGDIYQLEVKGSAGYLQLTDFKGLEEYASLPPKGPGLLQARSDKGGITQRNMNVMFIDDIRPGATARLLAEGDEPRFSPDGKRIVFVSWRTDSKDIWLMNPDGSQQTQLTTDDKEDTNPAFSPDGKHIVFASNRTGNYDLWVINSDGREMRQLTSDPADEMQPYWSVGGYLYYTRDMDENDSNIWRIKAPY